LWKLRYLKNCEDNRREGFLESIPELAAVREGTGTPI